MRIMFVLDKMRLLTLSYLRRYSSIFVRLIALRILCNVCATFLSSDLNITAQKSVSKITSCATRLASDSLRYPVSSEAEINTTSAKRVMGVLR